MCDISCAFCCTQSVFPLPLSPSRPVSLSFVSLSLEHGHIVGVLYARLMFVGSVLLAILARFTDQRLTERPVELRSRQEDRSVVESS